MPNQATSFGGPLLCFHSDMYLRSVCSTESQLMYSSYLPFAMVHFKKCGMELM